MTQNKLFARTRWRLAGSYALVMGSILIFCGVGLHRAIAIASYRSLDRELESVAGNWHDRLEFNLDSGANLARTAREMLPPSSRQRHLVGAIYRGDYYIRLFDTSEQLVASFGLPASELPVTKGQVTWKTITDNRGDRYRQISIPMHAQGHVFVGYLQMGRSLQELEEKLAQMQLILIFGIAIAILVTILSSWWLSQLAMQPIYQSYTQIQQFTADAAHELRTPLAALSATVESAQRTPQLTARETKELLNTLKTQNKRLTSLVADLLLLARMDAQKNTNTFAVCSLNEIIADLVEELADLAVANQIALETDIRVETALYVSGDESQLYRLISNLIVNAIQHTPTDGQVWVILSLGDRHHAQIQVTDTGMGIPIEAQARIFDRFYRINSDRSRHSGGTGLGLAIAKAIAESHGGTLQVSSGKDIAVARRGFLPLGEGATFTITLPVVLAPLARF